MTTTPVPVSGEDQPDPRVGTAARVFFEKLMLSPWEDLVEPAKNSYREAARSAFIAGDAADRAAGIRSIKPDPQLTEDSHRAADELYSLVARLEDGEELSGEDVATVLLVAAETLGRHRA